MLSSDVEINPGPVYMTCPACDTQVHIRRKVFMCSQVLTRNHRTPPGVVIETKLEGHRTNKVDKTKGESTHIQ